MNHKAVLATAFKALTRAQKANLKWHVEQDTPICCGEMANRYLDGKGGG